MVTPAVNQLAEKYKGDGVIIVKIDVDQHPDIPSHSRGVPTFNFYKNGNFIDGFSGADPRRLEDGIVKHKPASFSGTAHSLNAAATAAAPAPAPKASNWQAFLPPCDGSRKITLQIRDHAGSNNRVELNSTVTVDDLYKIVSNATNTNVNKFFLLSAHVVPLARLEPSDRTLEDVGVVDVVVTQKLI